jgi:hypothetical protein
MKHNSITERKNDAVLMQLDALTAELYLMGRSKKPLFLHPSYGYAVTFDQLATFMKANQTTNTTSVTHVTGTLQPVQATVRLS